MSAAAANRLILVDSSKLVIVDQGLDVESSEGAALQFDDLPTADPANVIPVFQTDTAFIRVLRYIHWTIGADDAVAFATLTALGGSAA